MDFPKSPMDTSLTQNRNILTKKKPQCEINIFYKSYINKIFQAIIYDKQASLSHQHACNYLVFFQLIVSMNLIYVKMKSTLQYAPACTCISTYQYYVKERNIWAFPPQNHCWNSRSSVLELAQWASLLSSRE